MSVPAADPSEGLLTVDELAAAVHLLQPVEEGAEGEVAPEDERRPLERFGHDQPV